MAVARRGRPSVRAGRWWRCSRLTLVLSAGLVFLVQPMFARFMLPLLGGAPAVWTAAMLFFQTVLLLSYLYAHWSIGRFGARRQAALHLALASCALIFLPIGLPDGCDAAGRRHAGAVAAADDAGVGRAAVLRRSRRPRRCSRAGWPTPTIPTARDPYFLYRASNIGSAVGLLSYPLLVEPRLTLDGQSWLWTGGYGLLMALLVALRRRAVALPPAGPSADASRSGRRVALRRSHGGGARAGWRSPSCRRA